VSLRVSTDSKKGFHLDQYDTYNYSVNHIHQDDTSTQMNREMKFAKKIINDHLTGLGLHLSDDPELLLNVGIVLDEHKQMIGYRRYDTGYLGDIKPERNREDAVSEYYDSGAITLDFVDIDKNEPVFQGTATGIMKRNERNLDERIQDAIEKMILDISKK
jgi:hypothetical protein